MTIPATRGVTVEDRVRAGLDRVARRVRADGLPVPALEGKLLRPLVAYRALAADRAPDAVPDEFWYGALAIQMVHEASLLHDDVLDGAERRRGRPTVAAERGVGAALVLGDHLLTAAYRVAARSGRPVFLDWFIRSVERTVAGELRQGAATGRRLTPEQYRSAIEGKSGELFGAALVLAADVCGEDPAEAHAAGTALGALYQMVDDFLDYCASARRGKPPFQDLRQKKWTFVLDEAGVEEFPDADGHGPEAFGRRLLDGASNGGPAPLERALARLHAEACTLAVRVPAAVAELAHTWVAVAERALARERAALAPSPSGPSTESLVRARAAAVGGPDAWGGYLARHGHSFRFASRLFPRRERRCVESVYAFCRFTDDLVDEAAGRPDEARALLAAWRELARRAYDGEETGVPLLDEVMGATRRAGVSFHYADELLAGVAMDLAPSPFTTTAELQVYTYRVAAVVGGWLTEMFGVRDPDVLARAYGLGHAMQLTNILRDVGEDWRAGRLYLPLDAMERHGVTRTQVASVARGLPGAVDDAWKGLMESLATRADRLYDEAFEALPRLPAFYARPVAVAARLYQGIHDALRSNDWDNGTQRAFTGRLQKVRLGIRGLSDLRKARRQADTRSAWTLAPQDG